MYVCIFKYALLSCVDPGFVLVSACCGVLGFPAVHANVHVCLCMCVCVCVCS